MLSFSCSEDDDTNENNPILNPGSFATKDFLKATIDGKHYNILKQDSSSNFWRLNTGRSSSSNDTLVVGFGNTVFIDLPNSMSIQIYFNQSFHDTSLLLNTNGRRDYHSNRNPFRYSSMFHNMFLEDLGEEKDFFYSQGHGNDFIPKKLYSGLVVEMSYNNQTYKSNKNDRSHPTSKYKVVNYRVIQKDRIPIDRDFFQLPSGKVKLEFNCVLYGPNNSRISIENAIYQNDISE